MEALSSSSARTAAEAAHEPEDQAPGWAARGVWALEEAPVVNPFWSEKAKEEAQLRAMRRRDLPVEEQDMERDRWRYAMPQGRLAGGRGQMMGRRTDPGMDGVIDGEQQEHQVRGAPCLARGERRRVGVDGEEWSMVG